MWHHAARVKTFTASVLCDVLRRLNQALGEKKWNLGGVDPRTQRRWFTGQAAPTVSAITAVAKALWVTIGTPANAAVRQKVFNCISRIVPNTPCDKWDEAECIAWFRRLLEDQNGPLALEVDVKVWIPERGAYLSVRETGVLPVNWSSRVRVQATLLPAAYCYLLWIDSNGRSTPLHPWKPGDWNCIEVSAPQTDIRLPEQEKESWVIETPRGVESVVLGACMSALEPRALKSLSQCWGGLAAKTLTGVTAKWQTFEGAVDPAQVRLNVVPKRTLDPMKHRHETLASRLKPYFSYVKILSFVNCGKDWKQR
jgi:hypothetical protein